jgi:DNA-binding response OmpR family regulator
MDEVAVLSDESSFIIVIDDDPLVPKAIDSATGARVLAYDSFAAYEQHSSPQVPTAVFLDIHLGVKESGLDLIPSIRARWPYCAIIVMTGETDGDAAVQALACGAHDFIRKPIEFLELSARMRARSVELKEKIRRDTVIVGDIQLNLSLCEVLGPQGKDTMSHSDAKLMLYLLQANGLIVSRQEIKRKLWGTAHVSDNSVDKKMHDLRKSLKSVGSQIKITASYGQGFSIIIPVTRAVV